MLQWGDFYGLSYEFGGFTNNGVGEFYVHVTVHRNKFLFNKTN
jgi:hypothetical protein